MSLFKLKPDAKVLFEIEDVKIVNYNIKPIDNDNYKGFQIQWVGDIGFGSFTYYKDEEGKEYLDTEGMGREWCLEMLKEIFDMCEVEYDDSEE